MPDLPPRKTRRLTPHASPYPQAPKVNAVVPRQALQTEAMVKVRPRVATPPRRFPRATSDRNPKPSSAVKPTTSRLTSSPPSVSTDSLPRLGRKRKPFYRIIAIDSRKRRDGAPLEVRFAPESILPPKRKTKF